jgi:hypothetical protein
MRFLAPLLFTLLLVQHAAAQDLGDRRVVLQEIAIPGMPGLQSFAWGQHEGEWLLVGGRTDGLHRRQPFAAFLAADNNTMAYVVNPALGQVWSAALNTLPTAQFEQLQSTNPEFGQRGDVLYVLGGYGYSATVNDHITHPLMSAINVPGAITAIKAGQSLVPHFRYLVDDRLAVTGGGLGLIDEDFLLVGGQRFTGRYNPMGPDFGPGFIQEYTNAIRRFRISDDGTALALTNYAETVDTANLHRRDYNLVPQVFPNGANGYTAFSGVFQYAEDIPWLNAVDVDASGYTVVPDFEQLLDQYHTAHLPAYSNAANTMHTIFFGGIGRYYFDENGQLSDDVNVPFVNTISRVTRSGSGAMQETAIGHMPALLGSSAEFIRTADVATSFDDIIDLDQLIEDTVVAGHIVGGIESSAANIFFTNTGTQSDATTRSFKVLLVRDTNNSIAGGEEALGSLSTTLSPEDQVLTTILELRNSGMVHLSLLDTNGRVVSTLFEARLPAGKHTLQHTLQDLAAGVYVVELWAGEQHGSVRFVR